MRTTVTDIRNKAKRIEEMLGPRPGYKFYLSVHNFGDGRNMYEIGWKEDANGGENPIGYHGHISGQAIMAVMVGIEEGLRWAEILQK